MSLFKLGDKQPQLGENAWVAPNATVIGDIRLGANSSIWFNATLRGDNDPIHIGDSTLIGIGSVILNRAVIGKGCIVGANTLIPEGKVFPDRVLIVGSPGKVIRELSDEDVARLQKSADHYVANARRYRDTLEPL